MNEITSAQSYEEDKTEQQGRERCGTFQTALTVSTLHSKLEAWQENRKKAGVAGEQWTREGWRHTGIRRVEEERALRHVGLLILFYRSWETTGEKFSMGE